MVWWGQGESALRARVVVVYLTLQKISRACLEVPQFSCGRGRHRARWEGDGSGRVADGASGNARNKKSAAKIIKATAWHMHPCKLLTPWTTRYESHLRGLCPSAVTLRVWQLCPRQTRQARALSTLCRHVASRVHGETEGNALGKHNRIWCA